MAYDYYYNQNTELCYKTGSINLSSFDTITTVKRILNSSQASTFINAILTNKFIYLKKLLTPYGYNHIIKIINDPYSVNLSIFIYNSDDQNNIYSSQNINKVFLKLLSDFVTFEQTKHILLQIINVDISLPDMEDFILAVPQLKSLLEIDNVQNKVISIGITEHFFQLIQFDKFLIDTDLSKWTDKDYKSLIFQVIHTLAIIHNKYPNFRHNNLNLKFMIGYIKLGKGVNKYMYLGNQYVCSNVGFMYKMNNFENSLIVDMLPNENISDKFRNINPFYDIHTFLNSFMSHIQKKIDESSLVVPKETQSFLKKYISMDIDNPTIIPNVVINDDYFIELKISQNNNEHIKNKKEDIIENKLSIQQLSNNMNNSKSKPVHNGFLHKGSRFISKPVNNDESASENNTSVMTGTRVLQKRSEDKPSVEKKVVKKEEHKDIEKIEDEIEDDDDDDESDDEDDEDDEDNKKPSSKEANRSKKSKKTKKNGVKLLDIDDSDSDGLDYILNSQNEKNKPAEITQERSKKNKIGSILNISEQDLKRPDMMNSMNPMASMVPQAMANQLSRSNTQMMDPQMMQQGMPPMGQGMPPMGQGMPPMMNRGMGQEMGMPPMGQGMGMPPMGQGMGMPPMGQGMGMPQGMGMHQGMGMPQMMGQGMGMSPMMGQGMPQMMGQDNFMQNSNYGNMMGGSKDTLSDIETTEDFFFFRHK